MKRLALSLALLFSTTLSASVLLTTPYAQSGPAGVVSSYSAPDLNGTLVTTPITVTYGTAASATLVQDLVDTYSYAKGDRLLVKYTTQASETLANCTVSFNYSQAGTSGSAVTSTGCAGCVMQMTLP